MNTQKQKQGPEIMKTKQNPPPPDDIPFRVGIIRTESGWHVLNNKGKLNKNNKETTK